MAEGVEVQLARGGREPLEGAETEVDPAVARDPLERQLGGGPAAAPASAAGASGRSGKKTPHASARTR